MEKIKPITPSEVRDVKESEIPNEVISVVNKLIAEKFNNHTATILQDDIVERIEKEMNIDSEIIFKKGWLNFEELYRKYGWEVSYDKPAYCETYPASFTFKGYGK